MKCSNCGGELIFEGEVAVCSSCGSKHKIETAFENTDVCIFYTEYDEGGKRTKDSIISAEIYKKLEAKKINTFYERVSASSVTGDDLELIRCSAISRAKIIIFVGTSEERFVNLFNKYSASLGDKKIIPVISDMKPEQLPEELRRFQASNFDAVGALNDLVASIMNMLGNDKDFELDEIYKAKAKKKKRLFTILVACLAVVLCAAMVLTIVFWPEKEETVVLTDADIYNNAIVLLDEGKYLEAAAEFNKVPDYKDSEKRLKKIYDRYDGYYLDEESGASLYLNIVDCKTAEFVFEKTVDKKLVKIEESMVVENNKFKGKYTDNINNEGNVLVKLSNQAITVKITTTTEGGDVSLGELEVKFKIKNKTDRPAMKTLTKEAVLEWINNTTYLEDVKAAGFELEYVDNYSEPISPFGIYYKIANTDIQLITTDYDLSKYNGQYDDPKSDKQTVVGVIATAEFMCPDKIGEDGHAFAENGNVFVPGNVVLYTSMNDDDGDTDRDYINFVYDLYNEREYGSVLETIKSDTLVGVTSENVLGTQNYNYIIKSHREKYLKALILKQYSDEYEEKYLQYDIYVKVLVEKGNYALICVTETRLDYYSYYTKYYKDYYYKMNLSTFKSEYIATLTYGYDGYDGYVQWKDYPEYFDDFLDESEKVTKKEPTTTASKKEEATNKKPVDNVVVVESTEGVVVVESTEGVVEDNNVQETQNDVFEDDELY